MNTTHVQSTWTAASLAALVGLAGCAGGGASGEGGAGAGGGGGGASVALNDSAVIQSPTATLMVLGMSCPLCASNVDKQLMDVPGVKAVKVDKGSGEVSVTFAQTGVVTRGQLAKAVHDSGFTLAGLRTP